MGRFRGIAFGLLTLFFAMPAFADEALPLVITAGTASYEMAPHFSLLEDPSNKLMYEEVSSLSFAKKFGKNRVLGWSHSAFWYRATIVNPSPVPLDMYMYLPRAWISDVTLYHVVKGQGVVTLRAGDTIPASQWSVDDPRPTFRLHLEAGSSTPVYFRVVDHDVVNLPFVLFTENAFKETTGKLNNYMGLFAGAALGLIIYNFLIFAGMRDRTYLWYVLYMASMLVIVLEIKGIAFRYFWPDSTWWNNRSLVVQGSLLQFAGVMFTRRFLETSRFVPRLDRVLKWYAFMHLASVPLDFIPALYLPLSVWTNTSPLFFDCVLPVTAYLSYRRGNRSARYFLLAFVFTLSGMGVFILGEIGVIPYGPLVDNAMEAGFLIEILLLSLALADRVNAIQEEKARAQAKALEQEAMVKHTLERAKEELEVKVMERTAELRAAKEQAEGATKLKDKFVALVSHDLRSPLASVFSTLKVLKDRGMGLDAPQRDKLHASTLNSVHSLLELIEQLLDISKLRSGVVTPAKRFVPLRDHVETILARIGSLAAKKGVTVENHVPPDMRLLADPLLLGEVLQNLVGNAIKFTKSGDSIAIRRHPTEPNAVTVADTGAGIHPAILPDLFKAEVKTSTPGTAGERGAGLGLPYCLEIIAAHGGTIAVESEVGKGSSFHIILRRYDVLILIADDQPAHRNLMKNAILAEIQAEFMEVENGVDALSALRECVPHLVITDLNMPEMDGLEFIGRVRALPEFVSLPVLAATSGETSQTTEAEAKRSALEAGASAFILKPVVSAQFVALTKRLLGLSP